MSPNVGPGKVSIDINEQQQGFNFRELFRYKKALTVSSIIGTVIGIVPGAGASIAGLLRYSTVKKMSNEPEKFGTGCVEGVIAAEAASGAVSGANILSLLTLGIPGNAAAAIFGAAFLLQGITPGPTIFVESGPPDVLNIYCYDGYQLLAYPFRCFCNECLCRNKEYTISYSATSHYIILYPWLILCKPKNVGCIHHACHRSHCLSDEKNRCPCSTNGSGIYFG